MSDLAAIPEQFRHLLPDSVLDLIDRVGLETAVRIVQWRGGRPLYVPPQPTAEMVEQLGEAGAAALCHHYGREYWGQVPKCQKALVAARDAAWLAAHEAGKTQMDIAAESGLTWLAVHLALHRARLAQAAGPPPDGRAVADERQTGFDW